MCTVYLTHSVAQCSLSMCGWKSELCLLQASDILVCTQALPDTVDRTKNVGEGGPPPFIPFKDVTPVAACRRSGPSSHSASVTMSNSHSSTTSTPKRAQSYQSENGRNPRESRQDGASVASRRGRGHEASHSAGRRAERTQKEDEGERPTRRGERGDGGRRQEGPMDRGAGENRARTDEKRHQWQARDERQLEGRGGKGYASHQFKGAPYPEREETGMQQRRDRHQPPQQRSRGHEAQSERKPFNSRRRRMDGEEGDDDDYRRPQGGYQLSDWLDLKLTANPQLERNRSQGEDKKLRWNKEEEIEDEIVLPAPSQHQHKSTSGRYDARPLPSAGNPVEETEQRVLRKDRQGERKGREMSDGRKDERRPKVDTRVGGDLGEDERRYSERGKTQLRAYKDKPDRRRAKHMEEEKKPGGAGQQTSPPVQAHRPSHPEAHEQEVMKDEERSATASVDHWAWVHKGAPFTALRHHH